MNTLRLIIFILVAAAHGFALYFFAFSIQAAPLHMEESARVMKLTDLAEYVPPPPEPLPPPPPPPPAPREEPLPDNAVEAIAEEMIETDEEPENQTVVEAGSIITPSPVSAPRSTGGEEEYLPAHRISVLPVFPEGAIRAALVYPPIARRSNIEGRVVLDLFIDRTGIIQRIDVLREDPPNRGFGEAAREAFRNIRCEPAQANGARVSARVRYPVTFRLR
jgi:protein TonB